MSTGVGTEFLILNEGWIFDQQINQDQVSNVLRGPMKNLIWAKKDSFQILVRLKILSIIQSSTAMQTLRFYILNVVGNFGENIRLSIS